MRIVRARGGHIVTKSSGAPRPVAEIGFQPVVSCVQVAARLLHARGRSCLRAEACRTRFLGCSSRRDQRSDRGSLALGRLAIRYPVVGTAMMGMQVFDDGRRLQHGPTIVDRLARSRMESACAALSCSRILDHPVVELRAIVPRGDQDLLREAAAERMAEELEGRPAPGRRAHHVPAAIARCRASSRLLLNCGPAGHARHFPRGSYVAMMAPDQVLLLDQPQRLRRPSPNSLLPPPSTTGKVMTRQPVQQPGRDQARDKACCCPGSGGRDLRHS